MNKYTILIQGNDVLYRTYIIEAENMKQVIIKTKELVESIEKQTIEEIVKVRIQEVD
jgi:hypothetical protein